MSPYVDGAPLAANAICDAASTATTPITMRRTLAQMCQEIVTPPRRLLLLRAASASPSSCVHDRAAHPGEPDARVRSEERDGEGRDQEHLDSERGRAVRHARDITARELMRTSLDNRDEDGDS